MAKLQTFPYIEELENPKGVAAIVFKKDNNPKDEQRTRHHLRP